MKYKENSIFIIRSLSPPYVFLVHIPKGWTVRKIK